MHAAVVGRRADLDERRVADERAQPPRRVGDDPRVDAEHALGRDAVRQAGEHRPRHHLGREEVVVRPRIAAPAEAGDPAVGVDQHAAEALRLGVRDQRHRDQRVVGVMVRPQRAQIDGGQRVAVQQQVGIAVEERQRVARAAGRAQHRLFPRIAQRQAEIAAVAGDPGDRLGAVVQVEDDARQAGGGARAQDARDQRHAGQRHRRLGADQRQRVQAAADAGGEQQGVRRPGGCRRSRAHAGVSNTMSAPWPPRAWRCSRKSER